MRALYRTVLLGLPFWFATVSHAQDVDGQCGRPARADSTVVLLQRLTAAQHPDVLSLPNRHSSWVVAYVIDPTCRVLAHGMTTRGKDHLDIDTTLATLFPNVRTSPFRVAGIAELAPDSTSGPGRPWLVWAVVEPDVRAPAP